MQHVRVVGSVLRQLGTDRLQLGFLLIAGEGDVAALPRRDALFKRRVVELATAPQDTLQLPLLRGSWPQLLLIRLVARSCCHLFTHA